MSTSHGRLGPQMGTFGFPQESAGAQQSLKTAKTYLELSYNPLNTLHMSYNQFSHIEIIHSKIFHLDLSWHTRLSIENNWEP